MNAILHLPPSDPYNLDRRIFGKTHTIPAGRKSRPSRNLRKSVAHFTVGLHLLVGEVGFAGREGLLASRDESMAESPPPKCPCGDTIPNTGSRICAACMRLFVEFYEHFLNDRRIQDTALGNVRLCGGNHEDAANALAEAFLRLFRRLVHGQWGLVEGADVETHRPLLLKYLCYCCIEEMRKDGRRRLKYSLEVPSLPATTPNPGQALETAEGNAVLESALAMLDRLDEAIIRMYHWETLSFEQIGERCGRSASSARLHYHAGIRQLRIILNSNEWDDENV